MSHRALGEQFVHYTELEKAYSHDWGVPMPEAVGRMKNAWENGDLSDTRAHDYDEYGGPEGWAKRVGAGQESGETAPIKLEKYDDEGQLLTYVVDGNHRALDAITRKLPKVPVEWE